MAAAGCRPLQRVTGAGWSAGAQSASLAVSDTMWRVLCVAAAAPVLLVLLLLLLAAAAAGRGAASLPGPGTPPATGAAATETDGEADVCCRREQHFVRVGVGEWTRQAC